MKGKFISQNLKWIDVTDPSAAEMHFLIAKSQQGKIAESDSTLFLFQFLLLFFQRIQLEIGGSFLKPFFNLP